jgi:hypothetical protein
VALKELTFLLWKGQLSIRKKPGRLRVERDDVVLEQFP